MLRGGSALAAVAIVVVVLHALAAGRDGPAGGLSPDDPEIIARGADVYAAQCAQCHGANLEGQPDWRTRGPNGRLPAPPHDETGHTWHHPDALLVKITKHGPGALVAGGYESDMPAYAGTLSDADIHAVLSFIKSTWPADIRKHQDSINEAARSQ